MLQKMKIGIVWLPRKASNHIHLRHTDVAAKIVIHELTHVEFAIISIHVPHTDVKVLKKPNMLKQLLIPSTSVETKDAQVNG